MTDEESMRFCDEFNKFSDEASKKSAEFEQLFLSLAADDQNIPQLQRMMIDENNDKIWNKEDVLSQALLIAANTNRLSMVSAIFDMALLLKPKANQSRMFGFPTSTQVFKRDAKAAFNIAADQNYFDVVQVILSHVPEMVPDALSSNLYISSKELVDHFLSSDSGGIKWESNNSKLTMEQLQQKYKSDILAHAIRENSTQTINFLLNHDCPINPDLILHQFIDGCETLKIKAAKAMLTHSKSSDLIRKSPDVMRYLSTPHRRKEKNDMKQEMLHFIESFNLKEALAQQLQAPVKPTVVLKI